MEDAIVTLGKRIRALRQRTGLSQEKFAARAGLDRTYYAGIERGERNPSVKQLAKIATALGTPLAALFAEESGRGGEGGDISLQSHSQRKNPCIPSVYN